MLLINYEGIEALFMLVGAVVAFVMLVVSSVINRDGTRNFRRSLYSLDNRFLSLANAIFI
jgi:hypothetical protein